MNKEYIASKELLSDYPYDLKVGIMFGRENCGLTNSEIILANKIISSLNIAHAVAIVCYELFNNEIKADSLNKQELATKKELSFLFKHLEEELDKRNFLKYLRQNRR